MVTGLAVLLGLFLVFDGWLLVKRARYRRQVAAARSTMTGAEQRRADAILAANEGRAQLQVALVQRDAALEQELSLAVSVDEGRLSLQSHGDELRRFAVRVGAEREVGTAPDVVRLVAPRGRFTVARVVDASYRWSAPDWLRAERGPGAASDVEGALGPVAILLTGGTIIYSDPGAGPLADASFVLPGAVRASTADLQAIADVLEVGMPVYFF